MCYAHGKHGGNDVDDTAVGGCVEASGPVQCPGTKIPTTHTALSSFMRPYSATMLHHSNANSNTCKIGRQIEPAKHSENI